MRITQRTLCLPDAVLGDREQAVIDLSAAEPGGPSTVIISKHQVVGPVYLAHTRSFHDDSAPIFKDPRPLWPGPDGTVALDARCERCRGAKAHIAVGEDETVVILQHRPGCRELARLAALMGVAP
jgi:hypothetical protein